MIPVVVSLGQSNNPVKRKLEAEVAARVTADPRFELVVAPNLYDLKAEGEGVSKLMAFNGDMIILTWMYSRAAHWMLNRAGVAGQEGQSLLTYGEDEDQEEMDSEEDEKPRVIDELTLPHRRIYCIDLRARNMFLAPNP